jgi:hypothetical protein
MLRALKDIEFMSDVTGKPITVVNGDMRPIEFFQTHLGINNFEQLMTRGYFLETKMLSEEQNNNIGLAHNDTTPVVDTITINGENATIIKPKTKTVKVK